MMLRLSLSVLLAGALSAAAGLGFSYVASLLPCYSDVSSCRMNRDFSLVGIGALALIMVIIFGFAALARSRRALDIVAAVGLGAVVLFVVVAFFRAGFGSFSRALGDFQSLLQLPVPLALVIVVQWLVFRKRSTEGSRP